MTQIYNTLPGVHPLPFNQPIKARPTTFSERYFDTVLKGPEAITAAAHALQYGKAKDHTLARLDDISKALGVAGIAGLGSLGLALNKQGGILPLWIGAFSWLLAMKITPFVLYKMVQLKTGLNLDTKYRSSNGEIRRLYQVPDYLPLQVVPAEERIRIARRLGIDINAPDAVDLLIKKIKQISVQTQTWWMLIAGVTTPVLAAFMCDLSETHIKEGWRALLQKFAQSSAEKLIEQPGSHPLKQAKALARWGDRLLGDGTDLTFKAQWWKRLSDEVPKILGLDKLHLADMTGDLAEHRFEVVSKHLYKALKDKNTAEALRNVLYTEPQSFGTLFDETLKPFEKALKRVLPQLESGKTLSESEKRALAPILAKLQAMPESLRAEQMAVNGTLEQLAHLAEVAQTSDLATFRHAMQNKVLDYLKPFAEQGTLGELKAFARQPLSFLNEIKKHANKNVQSLGILDKALGQTPRAFFENALSAMGTHRYWRRWFPGLLGGSVLALTIVYWLGCIGGNYLLKKPEYKEGGAS